MMKSSICRPWPFSLLHKRREDAISPRLYQHTDPVLSFDPLLVMRLTLVFLPMPVVTIVEEEVFVAAIRRKGYCRYAEAWKCAFESTESSERTRIPPFLSMNLAVSCSRCCVRLANCLRSRPWIFRWRWHARRLHEFADIEAGQVGSWRRRHSAAVFGQYTIAT